ncbi:diptericin A [Thrips palmi]|uniref:Diptericin A n=1 Tax=Thrips palmi TaxID=161013 RepID=A0A6P8ZMN7_THRPL|nr:diptericin A [Thrips palmi]
MHSVTVALLLCAVCAATASPFQPQGGPGARGSPAPAPRDNQRHGGIGGGIQRDKGVGTSVHVNGHADVWRSRDGSARVHAEGNYGQVVHGPAKGMKDYNGMVTFEKKF